MTTIVIVASGKSAKLVDYNRLKGAKIIAVNGAIDWLPRADWWFTLDMSAENKRRFNDGLRRLTYIACGQPGFPARISGEIPEPDQKNTPEWWLWRWSCKLGLSEDKNAIHTGNSAYGALGFAYHLRPNRIILCGVDADEKPRVDGHMTNNLSHLPLLFASAVPQLDDAGVEVLNASPQSKIDCFKKINPEEIAQWII